MNEHFRSRDNRVMSTLVGATLAMLLLSYQYWLQSGATFNHFGEGFTPIAVLLVGVFGGSLALVTARWAIAPLGSWLLAGALIGEASRTVTRLNPVGPNDLQASTLGLAAEYVALTLVILIYATVGIVMTIRQREAAQTTGVCTFIATLLVYSSARTAWGAPGGYVELALVATSGLILGVLIARSKIAYPVAVLGLGAALSLLASRMVVIETVAPSWSPAGTALMLIVSAAIGAFLAIRLDGSRAISRSTRR